MDGRAGIAAGGRRGGSDRLPPLGGEARSEDLAKVQSFLENKIVVQKLVDYGVSPEEAKAKVEAMSAQNLHRLASLTDRAAAGTDSALGILIGIAVLIILIIVILKLMHKDVIIRSMPRISRVPGAIGTVLGPPSTFVESAGGKINNSAVVRLVNQRETDPHPDVGRDIIQPADTSPRESGSKGHFGALLCFSGRIMPIEEGHCLVSAGSMPEADRVRLPAR